MKRRRRRVLIARPRVAAAVVGIAAAGAAATGVAGARPERDAGFVTAVKPLARGIPGSGWTTTPILSSGDEVPETHRPDERYRMVGVPDGLGVERVPDLWHGQGRVVRVLMTHELVHTPRQSDPLVGRPRQRGAYVDEWLMTREGRVLSGRRAYDRVFQDERLVGPPADATNATPAFSRFCSAYLSDRRDGFDRSIFFANEETPGPAFSPQGSQTVAIFDQEAHALSALGFFPRENTVVLPRTGDRTVLLIPEDGPSTPDSQLYLYVGDKRWTSREPLRRNGLVDGKLYAFASDDARDTENAIGHGEDLHGHWVPIPDAAALTDAQTEAVADAAGAFGFVRLEDGAVRPGEDREFWFASTGDQSAASGPGPADPRHNELGRLYRLRFDGRDPLAGATLTQVHNPDRPGGGAQEPVSPDNMDATREHLILSEDGTGSSRDDLERLGRDGSIWLLPFDTIGDPSTYERIVELVGRAEGGRDGRRSSISGFWETSGTVSAERAFGEDTYLFDVQAHGSDVPGDPPDPASRVVDEGQLLLLRRAPQAGRSAAGPSAPAWSATKRSSDRGGRPSRSSTAGETAEATPPWR